MSTIIHVDPEALRPIVEAVVAEVARPRQRSRARNARWDRRRKSAARNEIRRNKKVPGKLPEGDAT